MAYQLIRQWNVPGGLKGIIRCYYDPVIRAFKTEYGVGWFLPHDTVLTEVELEVPNNTVVSEFCNNYDRITLKAITTFPFLFEEVVENSPVCGYTAPPTPPVPLTTPPYTGNFIAYQVAFQNFEEKIVEANIFDMETFAEGRAIEYRKLKASGEPVVIECIDNDEDKFSPIRAKQCIIQFNSTSQYNLNLFSKGQDNRWYVEVKVNSLVKFKGFLVLNDLEESFLCPPNVVSLTATDNLGLLKDIPLTNFDGVSPIIVRPKTPYRWMDYLGWALNKTSLRLPINIQHNLREEHSPGLPFWASQTLDAKSFEEEIGECENAYEVIEKLLGEECFLTQHDGEWWIVRVDELDSRARIIYKIDADLSAYDLLVAPVDKTIKKTLDIKWINRTALVQLDRPRGSIKETYSFTYPKEIVDNIDFSRGGEIFVLIPPPNTRYYHLEDWTFARYPGVISSSSYIKRVFNDFGIEVERYAVITKSGGAGGVHYIASSRLPMSAKDKFSFSVDRKLELNRGGTGFFRTSIAQIRLYADDGTYWVVAGTANGAPPFWKTTDATFTTNADYIWQEGNLNTDDKLWVTISENVPPLPTGGEIEILLLQSADLTTTTETHFANLQIGYDPYLNGTYQKFNGQYWKVLQPGDYKSIRDEGVSISDSPKRLFKGALLRFISVTSKYVLSGKFYDHSLTPSPTEDDKNAYGWFQAQAVWNQYKRVMRIFDGELRGLTGDDLPDLIHRFILTDPSPHTLNRYFMCLHYSMNLKSCRWTAYFTEVFKTDEPKVYNDTTEFKLIENR